MNEIYLRSSRFETKQAIIGVIRSITGNATEHLAAAQGVHTAIGIAALSDIKSDFIKKARGGVGEDGERWPPLSQKYLAYGRRFGSGEQSALKKAAGLGSGHRNRGLLSAAQDKRWRLIFVIYLKKFASRMSLSAAKAKAAQIAWATLKAEGAKTKLEVYGKRVVEILRDKGVLFNSLSIGQLSADGEYLPPADQIFQLTESGVIVGTNVVYARAHNRGVPSKNLPKRQFIPVDGAPEVWIERWSSVAMQATGSAIRQVLGGSV